MDKYRSEWHFWKGLCIQGTDMLSSILRGKVFQHRLVDFAKIDMDTHTNEILFRTAQHHLDVDSPLNSLEVFVY
jgi:hypothetical protein